jgi:hypothetical protein
MELTAKDRRSGSPDAAGSCETFDRTHPERSPRRAGAFHIDISGTFRRIGPFLWGASGPTHVASVAKRTKRHVGLSQDSGGIVGALHCGDDNDDVREGSRSAILSGRATGTCGVFDKMPGRRRGLQQ